MRRYALISSLFSVTALMANLISVKFFHLSYFNLDIPIGVIVYPLLFFLSDLVTEVYGAKYARGMVLNSFFALLFGFLLIGGASLLPSLDTKTTEAFSLITKKSGILLLASFLAYFVSQFVVIQLYSLIKKKTGPRYLWLRSSAATSVAILIDTMIVNGIYLHWGSKMESFLILKVIALACLYKIAFSALFIPGYYKAVTALVDSKERGQ